jgi:hypothetical protein
MPSSAPLFMSEICQDVIATAPKTVLDVGIGFGHYGYLFRNYCDIFQGRYTPEEWQTRIVGVEAFPQYIHDASRYVYDDIIARDISEIVELLPTFDLIFCGDMIEHLPKDVGMRVLNELQNKSVKRFIVQVPLGMDWDQGEAFGNAYEIHRAVWTARDFEGWELQVRKFRGKEIGLAIC